MQNGFHPDTPRNPSPRFAQLRILWISFITFLSGNAKRICKSVLVNSVLFFFLLVMRALAKQLSLKTVQILSSISSPLLAPE